MDRRLIASAATAAALAAGGGAAASASVGLKDATSSRPQSATADDVSNGTFHLSFNATRPAGAPSNQASGVFDARGLLAGVKYAHVQGPVTCLDVRGNNVGLFYPVTSSEPALFKKGVRGIYIYVSVDGKGHATGMAASFSARQYTAGCAPVPGVIPAHGSATANS